MQNSRLVLSLQQCRETEVGNLEEEAVSEEDILGFEVSVCETSLVHIVESVHHLIEIGLSDFFREPSGCGQILK